MRHSSALVLLRHSFSNASPVDQLLSVFSDRDTEVQAMKRELQAATEALVNAKEDATSASGAVDKLRADCEQATHRAEQAEAALAVQHAEVGA